MSNIVDSIDYRNIKKLSYLQFNNGIRFYADIRSLSILDITAQANRLFLFVCIKGKLQMIINGKKKTISANELMSFSSNVILEQLNFSNDVDCQVLCLSDEIIVECLSNNSVRNIIFHFCFTPIIKLSDDCLQMFKLYGEMLQTKIRMEQKLFGKEIVLSIVKAALYELFECLDHNDTFCVRLTNQREILFMKFLYLISGCKVKPRKRAWYADKLCVTSKYLSLISKQISGKSVVDWINEFVIMDIRYMLKNSDKSIKEICEALDFPNLSFFCKYCKAHLGVSPTELRLQLRGSNHK